MPKTKVALTLDSELLERVDELVDRRRFRNRSQAIEAALADKLERLARFGVLGEVLNPEGLGQLAQRSAVKPSAPKKRENNF